MIMDKFAMYMTFKRLPQSLNDRPIMYSNGSLKAIAIGALFKGTNASIVRRDLYVKIEGPKRTDYYIVPEGSKLAGGSFVETVNVER